MGFALKAKFKPAGDQPQAIKKLITGLRKNYREQTLLGVTGSGKTFTMANVIAAVQRPTLVISPNKTLAAQLYGEFRQFFPQTAVHYFVSYYDYYQPEAYIPHTDTYIAKEATINGEIDRLRHAATQSLINRRDVIVIASVSCIYGIGEKEDYKSLGKKFTVGQKIKRNELLRQLIKIQYERNDGSLGRGQIRVRGEIIDIHLATGESIVRITSPDDKIERIIVLAVQTGKTAKINDWQKAAAVNSITILPAKHFLTPEEKLRQAITDIGRELKERLAELKRRGKLPEADRLAKKTKYDLEMMEEVGYCSGIENYSRHLSGRAPGEPPATLMDFFPKNYLLFIDESHVAIPQIRGMHAGDQARKKTLIEFGFRLPSALDNRPLNFREFNAKINQVIYVSATPQKYELERSRQIVEQIVRPTGLLDPKIIIRPSENQITDLIKEIKLTVSKNERVLATTITKRMAEELSAFLTENKIRAQYLHSEVGTLDRVEILRGLRQGEFDVLVGVNLLREGLDLPEVSLVAILDADITGFLRNETSLIQTIGRAARHTAGRVIMYAEQTTPAMAYAEKETDRRRQKQTAYNKKHGITPRTVQTALPQKLLS